MTTGLVAGVFVLYAHTIMPGLGRTDDRTFVGAFQAVDRAIINPWFMSCFFGALVLTGVSAALHLRADGHGGLPWIAVAFLLYLVVVVITLAVNVPLNDAIKATRTGSPTSPRYAGTSARRGGGRGTWSASYSAPRRSAACSSRSSCTAAGADPSHPASVRLPDKARPSR
jgi:uncharacterized membrane protein